MEDKSLLLGLLHGGEDVKLSLKRMSSYVHTCCMALIEERGPSAILDPEIAALSRRNKRLADLVLEIEEAELLDQQR